MQKQINETNYVRECEGKGSYSLRSIASFALHNGASFQRFVRLVASWLPFLQSNVKFTYNPINLKTNQRKKQKICRIIHLQLNE